MVLGVSHTHFTVKANMGVPNMRGKMCQLTFLLSHFASYGMRVMSSTETKIAAVSNVYAAT